MKLKTKYSPSDKVWWISRDRRKVWEPCSFCGAEGRIVGKDKVDRLCPECYDNKGKYTYHEMQYAITDRSPLTIGQVQISYTGKTEGLSEAFDNFKSQDEKTEERYMCVESGIGSGSVYYVADLYPSREKAQAECDKRNEAAVNKDAPCTA